MKYIRYSILFIILFILSSSLIKNIWDYQNKYAFYQDYKNNYDKEKQNNTALKTGIRKQSSNEELEKIIRNKLNLLKPNEVVVMIPTPTPNPIILTPTPAPNWRQWINLFLR
jgi:cell division protein FtsB